MNKRDTGGSVSSEGGICVSDDPILSAPGLMECGDEYVPDPDKWGEDQDDQEEAEPSTHASVEAVTEEADPTLMGDQAVYDDDDLGSPTTIARRD